ncbi:MAG: lysylphosphatidylglycerol synthase transmembrane domain-containing protein [Geminicoccaceae bacterium]
MRAWRLGFTLISLALLIWVVSPAEIASVIRSTDAWWLVTGLSIGAVATLVAGRVFQQILTIRWVNAPYGAVLAANLAGDFYALTLPLGLAVGGAVRLLRLGHDRQSMSGVFAAILASRLLEMFLQLSLALVAMLWIWDRLPSPLVWASGLGLGILFVGCCHLAVFHRTSRRWALFLITLCLPRRSRLARPARRVLARIGRVRAVGWGYQVQLLATGVLRHLLGATAFLAFAAAANAELTFAESLWVRGVTGIAMLLPVSVAGLGLRELSYVALLALFGVAPASALAMSLMVFFGLLLNGAAGGMIELGGVVRPTGRLGSSASQRRS